MFWRRESGDVISRTVQSVLRSLLSPLRRTPAITFWFVVRLAHTDHFTDTVAPVSGYPGSGPDSTVIQ